MSHKGYPIIEILNLRIKMKEVFESKYLTEMKCLIKECGGCPLIVQHDDVWKWRGSKNPGSIIINQWPDWESYHKYSTKDETRKLEELRKTIGCGYKIVAELIIDM
uniref:Uncharacterized protein n=1 Tax=Trichobilharzia regenti TaxID=157069 RepID=A0AA85JGK8_TRIRE|nr:unnamed protein product [Trichobilharzia regenti]